MRYSLIEAYEVGEKGNAPVVVRQLGISFLSAEPQPIADQWMFYGIDKSTLPENLPNFLEIIDD
jgi:hypothetical protein